MIYFAYGSNMNPAQMTFRCPEHRTIGIARLDNYRLYFPRFSRSRNCASAGIEPVAGNAVWGVLYDVPPADVLVLNHHEGYDPEGPVAANKHILRDVTVKVIGQAELLTAKTYFAVPDGTTGRPSEAYMQAIVDGALYHGLPKAYVAALESVLTR